MIKLCKTDKPDILERNADAWTKEFLKNQKAGEKPTSTDNARYRHPEIKSALVAETNGKCAYCESKIKHIHHGDVEHISPKSLDPEKRYEWSNLTLACEICNQNKSDRDPKTEHIIDPYVIDPANHLTFMGTMIFGLGTIHGKNTEILLDLNRVALLERRRARLEQIMGQYDTILREDLPIETRKIIYQNFLKNEISADSEYAGMIRDVSKSMTENIPPEIKN